MKRFDAVIIRVAVAGFLVFLGPATPLMACPAGHQIPTGGSDGNQPYAMPRLDVAFDSRRKLLKVTAQGHTLDELLAAIANATPVHFTRVAADCEPVSVAFDFLPLETALARVLTGRNYVLSESPQGGTTGVWILPTGEDGALPPTALLHQEFYSDFQGVPESEQFARELKDVEQELTNLQAAGR